MISKVPSRQRQVRSRACSGPATQISASMTCTSEIRTGSWETPSSPKRRSKKWTKKWSFNWSIQTCSQSQKCQTCAKSMRTLRNRRCLCPTILLSDSSITRFLKGSSRPRTSKREDRWKLPAILRSLWRRGPILIHQSWGRHLSAKAAALKALVKFRGV